MQVYDNGFTLTGRSRSLHLNANPNLYACTAAKVFAGFSAFNRHGLSVSMLAHLCDDRAMRRPELRITERHGDVPVQRRCSVCADESFDASEELKDKYEQASKLNNLFSE